MPPSSSPERLEQFKETWRGPTGFAGWFAVVNNQPLGKRFMVTAFSFFVAGGVLALLMRIQLAVPENGFIGPQVYNQLFSMHGSTMMYLFAVPFLEGLALYLLPMMLGSRDVAFPRLTAFSYWTYLFGGIIFYASFLVGTVPDAGWFSYVPLSRGEYSGQGMDFWLLGLAMVEIAGIGAGVEIVVSILKLRAPGMGIHRMPIFAWTMLVSGVMILFAFTTLLVGTALLEMDRAIGTRIFDVLGGGNAHLWQHLFWFFGHPEVYIIFLPATGIVSTVVATSAGRPLVGYVLVVMAVIVTGFLSFGLWVHHMYTTGLPELSLQFFAAASLMIGIASGIQVFAWIGTLWGTAPRLDSALLYVLGFLFIFVLGGITGVMIAVVPFNWQVHDTFFIVAHFHYVLIGGAVFPVFAGLHHWLPKMTGRMLSERLGKWSFWLSFIGFNLTFFPMHIMGLMGLPRRVYTYPAELQVGGYNMTATIGAFLFAAGFILIVVNLIRSLSAGPATGGNPWKTDTLEWSLASPPPIYSFMRPPVVYHRNPLWNERKEGMPADEAAERAALAMDGEPARWRATLGTDPLTAKVSSIQYLAGPSLAPFFSAVGLLAAFVGVLIGWYGLLPAGTLFAALWFARWLYPTGASLKRIRESDLPARAGLPVFTLGSQAAGWWGMVAMIVIAGTALAVLFYAYFYLWLFSADWPQGGLAPPPVSLAAVSHALLAAAGGAACWSWRSFRAGNFVAAQGGFGLLVGLAVASIAAKSYLHAHLDFLPQDHAYGSIFYVMSWLLLLYVVVGLGLVAAAVIRLWNRGGAEIEVLALQMQITALFWYFIAAASLSVFAVLYLAPHVLT